MSISNINVKNYLEELDFKPPPSSLSERVKEVYLDTIYHLSIFVSEKQLSQKALGDITLKNQTPTVIPGKYVFYACFSF